MPCLLQGLTFTTFLFTDAVSEIQMCADRFRTNRCGTDLAVPALDAACATWARCMARDPAVVGRARVAAETFAEIVNGFVDVISWKSMVSWRFQGLFPIMPVRQSLISRTHSQIFCLAVLTIVVRAANSTFNFFRSQSKDRREKREREEHERPLAHPPIYPYPQTSYMQSMHWRDDPLMQHGAPLRSRRFMTREQDEQQQPSMSLR